jgi:hypothetical protein
MIVAIPYFPGYTDYSYLTKSINAHGLCDGHRLLVIGRRVDEEAAMSFEESVSENFSGSTHRVVDQPQQRGRFAVANEMFRQSLWYMKNYEPGEKEMTEPPLLYFDPVLRMPRKGWADAVQSEYFARGMPRVLACQKTRTDGIKEIWGAALFNKEYVTDSALLAHLPGHAHWRDYLRHEIGQHLVISETLFPRGKKAAVSQSQPGKAKTETPAPSS